MKDRLQPEIHVLKNGITVYHIPADVPYVTARFVVPFGSGHNTEDITWGTFHFLEHVVLQRSKLYPEYKEWQRNVGLVGGYSNAMTSRTCTSYEVSLPAGHLDLLQGLFSAVHNPIFNNQDVIGERGIIRNERKMKERWFPGDNEISHYMYTEWLSEDAEYIYQRLGRDEDLEKITAEYLERIHKRFYFSNKSFLIISGSFDMNTVVAMLENVITTSNAPVFQDRILSWNNPDYREVSFTDASRYTYYFQAISSKSFATDLLYRFALMLLVNTTQGPLYQWLREEKKWVYGVGSSVESTYENMSFGISLPFSEHSNVDEARGELKNNIIKAFSDKDLIEREKDRYFGRQAFSFATPEEKISFLLGTYRTYGRFYNEEDITSLVKNISSSDLLAIINNNTFGELLVTPKK